MGLSRAQVEEFARDGVIVVRDLVTASEIETLRAQIDCVIRGESNIPEERLQVEPLVGAGELQADSYARSLRKMSHVAFFDDVFEAHARNDRILDCIQALLGVGDIKLYQDQLFMKPPKVGSRQSYHQDQPLGFDIEPVDMVTCWAALDRATIENGCLWMLPGTHKLGATEKENWKEYEQRAVDGRLPEERAIELEPGDCSFHHGLTLHSSRPNMTDQKRWGYATHYVSAHCRYTGSPESVNDAMLMRGKSIPGCV
jgi:phytanoyl-CoA hydroxylase